MVMDAVVERCVEQSPVIVMARLALQRALEQIWINDLFERERGTQYTRELLFSTRLELMSVVAVGLRPSVHAAAQACKDLSVSVQALYDKIKGTAPRLVRALVQGSALRLDEVLAPTIKEKAPTVCGYRLRIVDGNHFPASDKRLKPLRGFRGAALPDQLLLRSVFANPSGKVVPNRRSVHTDIQQVGKSKKLGQNDQNRPFLRF